MINVTKPYLPDIKKFNRYVEKVFQSGQLTNNGPLVRKLESRLREYLGVEYLVLVSNGTIALQLAYKALELNGEVVTTPFTFAATSSSLRWEGLKPRFADICPENFNVDLKTLPNKINSETSALVPVHVYGNPCEVEEISRIAASRNLKVVYDASHSFDVSFRNSKGNIESILKYGDISTLSFHSTKLFHTVEGGAIITNSAELDRKVRELVNFGLDGSKMIASVGINAKMNEFEAAMGLCVLDDMPHILQRRKEIWLQYHNQLENAVGYQKWNPNATQNFAYAPIVFKDVAERLRVQSELEANSIYARQYFFPSLDTQFSLNLFGREDDCPISRDLSDRILCLPLFADLDDLAVSSIIRIILQALK